MSHPATPWRTNPGKTASIVDQFELLIHAQSCRIGDASSEETCAEPRCSNLKKILYHGLLCDRGECCSVEGCFRLRKMDKHLRRCVAEDCAPCAALRTREEQNAQTENTPPPKVDAVTEKRRLQIRLLEFVLHMNTCQSLLPRMGNCGLENCEDLEDALLHKPICDMLSSCPYPGCIATCYVLSHWNLCAAQTCLICDPFKQNAGPGVQFRTPPCAKPRSRFFIAQHVEQLFHALSCIERDQDLSQEIHNCPRPNCELMKGLLQHLPDCNDENCPKAQCLSSKQILKHWTTCSFPDCPSCVDELGNRQKSKTSLSAASASVQTLAVPELPDLYPPTIVPQPLAYSPDRLPMTQKMLVVLLHSLKCATRSRLGASGLVIDPCSFKHCEDMLKVYHHILACENYELCEACNHCVLARKILHHWKSCTDNGCELCFPLATGTRAEEIYHVMMQDQVEGLAPPQWKLDGEADGAPGGNAPAP